MEYKNILNNTNNLSHSNFLSKGLVEGLPIAFFDSGVGGLTVFEKVKKILPQENYLYFGDTKNMPYGEKTVEELVEFADKILKFFEKQHAKAVVIACNTSSAIAYEKLKDNYNFKIYPIIQSVSSKLAKLDVKKLCVIATPATIKSHMYSKEIAKYNPNMQVIEISAPNWVRIVEEHKINQVHSIEQVKEILEIAQSHSPDRIVLACTHYPYLMNVLKKFMPEDIFIDPSIYFAQIIKNDLEVNGLLNNKFEYEKFFVSAEPENFKIASELFYKLDGFPNLVTLV